MTKEALILELKKLKIKPRNYSLDEGLKYDAINLKTISVCEIAVFYTEKNQAYDTKVHTNYESAYKDLLQRLVTELNKK